MAETSIPADLIERAESTGIPAEEVAATACCASCIAPIACWQGAPCRLEQAAERLLVGRLHDAMPEARRT